MAEKQTNSGWQVESLRLTVFPKSGAITIEDRPWEQLIGTPPEITTLQRPSTLHEQGQIRGGLCNLSFDHQPGRIDWLLSPILQANQELKNFPTFGSFKDILDVFKETIGPWVKNCPPSQRIAFGAIITLPVRDKEDGYITLQEFLPSLKLDPKNSADLSYMINRPRTSKTGIPGLLINRLTRWTVIRLNSMQLQFLAPTGQIALSAGGTDICGCRAEIDVNTPPDYVDLFNAEQAVKIFNELTALAAEIAEQGDRP